MEEGIFSAIQRGRTSEVKMESSCVYPRNTCNSVLLVHKTQQKKKNSLGSLGEVEALKLICFVDRKELLKVVKGRLINFLHPNRVENECLFMENFR